MAISKVIFGQNTLIDLTNDTIQPDKLVSGYTAHDAGGNLITGTYQGVEHTVDSTTSYQKVVSSTVEEGHSNNAIVNSIGGNSVVWNQLTTDTFTESTYHGVTVGVTNGAFTANGTCNESMNIDLFTVNVINGHKYFLIDNGQTYPISQGAYSCVQVYTQDIIDISTYENSSSNCSFETATGTGTAVLRHRFQVDTVYDLESQIMLFDLTQMFGSGNEPSSIDDPRITWAISYAETHPEYNAGEIVNADVTNINSYDPVTLSQALPAYGIDINGLHNEIDFAAKKYIQSIGAVDAGTLSWNTTTAQSGATVYYASLPSGKRQEIFESLFSAYELSNVSYNSMPDKKYVVYGSSSGHSFSRIAIRDDSFASAQALKESLYSSVIAYELNTIVETDISDVLDNAILGTLPIPSAIQSLPAYGAGIGDVYNEVDFAEKKYKQKDAILNLSFSDMNNSEDYPGWKNSGIRSIIGADIGTIPAGVVYISNCSAFGASDIGVNTLNANDILFLRDTGKTQSQLKELYAGKTFQLVMTLEEPVEIDISTLIPSTFIPVHNGGTLTFESDSKLPVPSKVMYIGDEGQVAYYGGEIV